MNQKIGELTFLEQLAGRYKIPVPEYLVEPVAQSALSAKLERWGAGIVKPDILSGKRGKAGTIRRVTKVREALSMLKKVAAQEFNGQQARTAYTARLPPVRAVEYTIP